MWTVPADLPVRSATESVATSFLHIITLYSPLAFACTSKVRRTRQHLHLHLPGWRWGTITQIPLADGEAVLRLPDLRRLPRVAQRPGEGVPADEPSARLVSDGIHSGAFQRTNQEKPTTCRFNQMSPDFKGIWHAQKADGVSMRRFRAVLVAPGARTCGPGRRSRCCSRAGRRTRARRART